MCVGIERCALADPPGEFEKMLPPANCHLPERHECSSAVSVVC